MMTIEKSEMSPPMADQSDESTVRDLSIWPQQPLPHKTRARRRGGKYNLEKLATADRVSYLWDSSHECGQRDSGRRRRRRLLLGQRRTCVDGLGPRAARL
jgi:hypothetical protein